MLDPSKLAQQSVPENLSLAAQLYSEAEKNSDPNVFDIFRALMRHRWKIIFILLAFLACTYLYLNQTRPLYTARAEIILEKTRAPIDFGQALLPSGGVDKELQTELQVIRSRAVLGDVIEALDLLRDPEFNPTVPPPPPSALKQWVIDRGWWPIDFTPVWPSKSLESAPSRTDDQIMRIAIDRLRLKTEVSEVRGTSIMVLNVTAWTPQKAALIANSTVEAYIASRIEVKLDAQRFASQFIGARIVELREEVEAAESKVQTFQSDNAVVTDAGIDVARYEELRDRVEGAEALSRDLSTRLKRFETALKSEDGLNTAARALDDRRINALLTAGYGPEIRSEIEEAAARLKADQRVAARRAEALGASLIKLEASLESGTANLVRLRQLEREAEASKQLFETFLIRQKETAVQQDLAKPDARLLTEANSPYRPSYPNDIKFYAMATALGLALAIVFVFQIERSRNRFVNIEELEAYTGHSVLGSIPRYKKARRRRTVVDYVRAMPGGSMAEAVRNLRTSILLANVDQPPKVIVVTSSVPEEGKSLTTLLLGLVTAQMGKRAILIDADLRRRTLHNTLNVKSDPGLIALLNGSARLEDAVRIDEKSGLHALPVERTKVSAPDLLASESFSNMIKDLRNHYDLILLDAPPVLPVTDARILAKMADALIYVVKWNDTPRDIVIHGLSSLKGIGVHISGLVMTQVDRDQQKKYGYGYYGNYGYGSYKYYKKSDRYYTD